MAKALDPHAARAARARRAPKPLRTLTEGQVVSAIRAAFKDRPLGAAFLVDGGRVVLELGKRLGYNTDESLLEFARQCAEDTTWRVDGGDEAQDTGGSGNG